MLGMIMAMLATVSGQGDDRPVHPDGPERQFREGVRPAVRAPTELELAIARAMNRPMVGGYASGVPEASRILSRCLQHRNERTTLGSTTMRWVESSLQNNCGVSLRVRVGIGEYPKGGPCEITRTLDGVFLPEEYWNGVKWYVDSNDHRIGCVGMFEVLGIPDWTADDAARAQRWITERARSGQVGLTAHAGVQWAPGIRGNVQAVAAEWDGICTARFDTPELPTTMGRSVTINWAAVSKASRSGTRYKMDFARDRMAYDWQLDFALNVAAVSSAYEGTVHAAVLTEYCRTRTTH